MTKGSGVEMRVDLRLCFRHKGPRNQDLGFTVQGLGFRGVCIFSKIPRRRLELKSTSLVGGWDTAPAEAFRDLLDLARYRKLYNLNRD